MKIEKGRKYKIENVNFMSNKCKVEVLGFVNIPEKCVRFKILENTKNKSLVRVGQTFVVNILDCKKGFKPIKNKVKKL